MSMILYNSLTRSKESFTPLEEGKVKLYVCGPTVYDLLHIGNFRGPVFYDTLRKWLEKLGYSVTYVYNYTDVDDKIIQRSIEEKVEASVISERYIEEFQKDYQALGLRAHDFNPRVSEHMSDIIKMIQDIINNGHGYVVDGEVFFSISSFKDYGKLSNKVPEDLIAGSRIEVDQRKKNPLDFTLWKPAKPGEPKWESPWGEGRPGWHIECSAMNCAIHGEQIDIHGGGSDLIFPHHENEIAQSEAANHKQFATYWVHNNMINFGGGKMSKSVGNITTMRSFIEKYDAEIYKYMILSAHYRSIVDMSEAQIKNAVSGLARIYSAMSLAESVLEKGKDKQEQEDKKFTEVLAAADKKIFTALCDDMNTPEAFAAIFEVVRAFNSLYVRGKKINGLHVNAAKNFLAWVRDQGELMSLFRLKPAEYLAQLDDRLLKEKNVERSDVDQLVAGRKQAREAKDFSKADEIREELDRLGIQVLDTPEGTVWEVQK